MRFKSWLFAALALAASTPAAAQWHQARTDHFSLTINASAQEAERFAARLEAFDSALRRLYGIADTADRRARPVSIYALSPKLFLDICECTNMVGYYNPRGKPSVIVSAHVPKVDAKAQVGGWSSQAVLLHEYAHHFAATNFPMALPYWFQEGFAEFNAQATFESDGSIIVGYPAHYRAASLKSSRDLTPKQMFEPERYGVGEGLDLIYARGWLLTNYLMLHPRRKGQLTAFLDIYNSGVRGTDAAARVFGDLRALEKELQAYSRGQLSAPLRIPPAAAPPRVVVTALTEGQAEMFPIFAHVESGSSKARLKSLAKRAEKIASRYPTDPVVQLQFAEAAATARYFDDADSAADRALSLNAGYTDALLIKGLIALERGTKDKTVNPNAAAEARRWFVKANKTNPDAVLPLYFYHRSYVNSGVAVPRAAVTGLLRAAVLAPESAAVRGAVARQMIVDGDVREAREMLEPLAYSPHGGKDNVARKIIDMIDAGKIAEAKTAIIEQDEDE